MKNALVKRPRGLASMTMSAAQAKVLDHQVHLQVQHQTDRVSAYRPLLDQFRELARNCYLQGLLDGQQVRVPTEASNA